MKKISQFSMAILLVPWVACNEVTPIKSAPPEAPATTPTVDHAMILPEVPDTTLPSGRKNIYLTGRRNTTGFYIERSIFPAGYKGMPHVHNADVYFTVLKGTCYFVTGNTFDPEKARPYGPGSFVEIKAEQPHYEWFPEECTLQIEGIGPTETFYVNTGTKKD